MANGKKHGTWSARTLAAVFLRMGWEYLREGKEGAVYRHPDREGLLIVPRTGKELHDESLHRILQGARVSRRELLNWRMKK